MQRPKTLTETGWHECTGELIALYVTCTLGVSFWLSVHWSSAMLIAPLAMVGVLAAIFTLVQVMWLFVVSLEKVGTSIGLRKSPLA